MIDERARAINPIVPESVAHNSRVRLPLPLSPSIKLPPKTNPPSPAQQVLSQIRSLTASLFGIAAGTLGLESGAGFVFYFVGTVFVSELVTRVLAAGKPERYFENVYSELALKDVFGGLMSFVLTWTLFFGLVRS
ncbi:hypothetical protein MMC10_009173 [Thelotrema lepadinum]|nr:hypothetical protein [Thelotrema lepadinum]